jgi:hypothetical protein
VVREPILLRSVLHDREIEVALTMARIEPLSTQPGPIGDTADAYSITLSARTNSAGGTVTPIALAVLRLITSEALPQTDEVYAEDGALIAIANDRWTPIEPAGTMP